MPTKKPSAEVLRIQALQDEGLDFPAILEREPDLISHIGAFVAYRESLAKAGKSKKRGGRTGAADHGFRGVEIKGKGNASLFL